MTEDQNPTVVDEVALPIEIVTLKHLKTKAGDAVRVRCEALSVLVLADVLKALPGARPPQPEGEEQDPLEMLRTMNAYALPLIELATAMVTSSGREVRPAFWFREKVDPDSLPGRLLHEEDKMALVASVLRLGGYVDASEGAFPVPDGVGSEPSVGA